MAAANPIFSPINSITLVSDVGSDFSVEIYNRNEFKGLIWINK